MTAEDYKDYTREQLVEEYLETRLASLINFCGVDKRWMPKDVSRDPAYWKAKDKDLHDMHCIEKTKEKSKTIVQLSLTKFNDLISKSLEEFGIKENFKDLIDLYYLFKKDLKMMYRVPFAKDSKWSKFKNRKSHVSRLDVSLSSLRF